MDLITIRNRALFLLLLFFQIMLLPSCELILVPLEYVYNAGEYKKDVSDDPERNMLVGREFVLKEDMVLFQYTDREEFFISKQAPYVLPYPMESEESIRRANQQFIPFRETVQRGTKLKVSQVLVMANHFGGELSIRYVRAQFTDLTGKLVIADISNLFKHTLSTESWNLVPEPELLVEVAASTLQGN